MFDSGQPLDEHGAMTRALFAPKWKLVGPTPEGLNILRALPASGQDWYTVASPYQKLPFFHQKPRWTWTRPRAGERPVFEGSPYDEGHLRHLHSWFLDIPALQQLAFTNKMGIFLAYIELPSTEEDAALRLDDAKQLHEDTRMHHADWRSRKH